MFEKFQKVKEVEITEKFNGYWIIVHFENGTKWVPKLVDLAKMLNLIGQCEDLKYPNGEGYKYTQRFINECFGGGEVKLKEIFKRYKLEGEKCEEKM